MNDAKRICAALADSNYRLTLHAQQRMAERLISDGDIMHCGKTASRIIEQKDGKYKVEGHDLDSIPISVVCAWDGQTIVITVF